MNPSFKRATELRAAGAVTSVTVLRERECVRCMVDGLLDRKGESIVLSCLDVVALDLGIHPHADHKHVVARGEADICGSTCKYVGERVTHP